MLSCIVVLKHSCIKIIHKNIYNAKVWFKIRVLKIVVVFWQYVENRIWKIELFKIFHYNKCIFMCTVSLYGNTYQYVQVQSVIITWGLAVYCSFGPACKMVVSGGLCKFRTFIFWFWVKYYKNNKWRISVP